MEELRIVEGAWHKPGKFVRNVFMDKDEFPAWRALQCRNIGVYRSAFLYSRPPVEKTASGWVDVPEKDVLLYGGFYIDLDRSPLDEEGWREITEQAKRVIRTLDIAYGLAREQVEIAFSGSKGIHLYIPPEAMGIEPSWYLNAVFRYMAEGIQQLAKATNMDLRVYDRRRVMRVMNTIHHKSRLFKVPLRYEELSWPLAAILELAKLPRALPPPETLLSPRAQQELHQAVRAVEESALARRRAVPDTPVLDLETIPPPCIQALSTGIIGPGERNSAAFILASHLFQRGIPQENALERLLNWASHHTDPQLPDKEVQSVVDSVYRHRYTIGCRGIEELATCFKEQCPIYRQRHGITFL